MTMRWTPAARRHFLIPKVEERMPYIPPLANTILQFEIGDLAPDERKAMAHIAGTADAIEVGDETWLLFPATDKVLDTLAAFGAEAEDRENDLEDEKDEGEEDDRANDYAFDQGAFQSGSCADHIDGEDDGPAARARFIRERQKPDVYATGYGGEKVLIPGGYDPAKDEDEMVKARWFTRKAKRLAGGAP